MAAHMAAGVMTLNNGSSSFCGKTIPISPRSAVSVCPARKVRIGITSNAATHALRIVLIDQEYFLSCSRKLGDRFNLILHLHRPLYLFTLAPVSLTAVSSISVLDPPACLLTSLSRPRTSCSTGTAAVSSIELIRHALQSFYEVKSVASDHPIFSHLSISFPDRLSAL